MLKLRRSDGNRMADHFEMDRINNSARLEYPSPHSGFERFLFDVFLWFAPQATCRRCSAANRRCRESDGGNFGLITRQD